MRAGRFPSKPIFKSLSMKKFLSLIAVGLLTLTAVSAEAQIEYNSIILRNGAGQMTISAPNSGTNTFSFPASSGTVLTNPMTTLGDLLYGGAAGAVTRLAGNTVASNLFLRSVGDGTNAVAPSWSALDAGDVTTGIFSSARGGTGNGFTKFAGATSAEKTYTLPDASTTILTDNADVTLAQGGTGASLTASNGGIFYSTGTAGAILAGTATAGQMLQSGAGAAPAWSTATFPATTAVSQILYSSATNTVAGLATANNGVLITDGSGVPSISSDLPDATQDNITRTGTIVSGTWNGTDVGVAAGGTGLDGSAAANGSLLIGNGSGYALAVPTGSTNEVDITTGAGTLEIGLPAAVTIATSLSVPTIARTGNIAINPTTGDRVTTDGGITAAENVTITSGGLTVTAGGVGITAGGLSVTAGATVNSYGTVAAGATPVIPANTTVVTITDDVAALGNAATVAAGTNGQLLYVYNADATSATLEGITIASGKTATFVYAAGGWRHVSTAP